MLGPTFLIECDISLLIYVASGLGPLGGDGEKVSPLRSFFALSSLSVLQTFPADHLGRIFFSLTFDYTTESLSAHIKKIKNLPRSTKEGGITNKTYVK